MMTTEKDNEGKNFARLMEKTVGDIFWATPNERPHFMMLFASDAIAGQDRPIAILKGSGSGMVEGLCAAAARNEDFREVLKRSFQILISGGVI